VRRVLALLVCVVCLLAAAGCGADAPDPSGVYYYEDPWAECDFSITILPENAFGYSMSGEQAYSSLGTWKMKGDIITLTEDAAIGNSVLRFQVREDALVYIEEGSVPHPLLTLKDGHIFWEY